MKRLFFIFLGIIVLLGCGAAARESGFYDHKTMYGSWEHLKFSIFGYKQVDQKEAQLSKEEDWWGKPIDQPK